MLISIYSVCSERDQMRREKLPDDPPVAGSSATSATDLDKEEVRYSVIGSKRRKQTKLSAFFSDQRPCPPSRSDVIDGSIAKMIATDLMPVSVVEGVGFQNLMTVVEPNYNIPSRQSMVRRLENLYETVKKKVEEIISKTEKVALTTDMWTSRTTNSYITVTAHYLRDNYTIHTNVLETVEMEERHTSENLVRHLSSVIRDWGIENKVVAIIHDNASNFVSATATLPYDGLTCFAHTLQLSISKGLEMAEVEACLKMCTKVVSHFRHSTIATKELAKRQELLKLPTHRLIQFVKTRWNSSYDMLERLVEQRRGISDVLTDRLITKAKDYQALELSEAKWQLIEELLTCLKPLRIATSLLCSEKQVTVSSVLPVAYSLINIHLAHSETDSEVISDFKENIKENLIQRLKLHNQNTLCTTVYAISAFLDPRYKALHFFDDYHRQKTIQCVREKCDELIQNDRENLTLEEDNAPLEGQIDMLLGPDYHQPKESGYETEIHIYTSDPTIRPSANPFKWWEQNQHRLPHLAKVARNYLIIPGTSVPSERVFSTAGNIISATRNRITPEHANMLIFLNKNLEI